MKKQKQREILVVGDAHVASLWDRISTLFPRKKDFLNPNQMLRRLAGKVRENQVLVTNGDMVDYYFSDYFPGDGNNLDLVEDILKPVRAKTLHNVGNHEYRSGYRNVIGPGAVLEVSHVMQGLGANRLE